MIQSLAIIAQQTALVSGTPGAVVDDAIARKASSYTHTISAKGGFTSAAFQITAPQAEIQDWIDNGLGRHIVVLDDALDIVWEGFVNRISASIGPLAISRGPVLGIANKIKGVYQTVTYNTNPPVGGDRVETSYQSDADSQLIYGIFEQIISVGTLPTSSANTAVSNYLASYAWPETSLALNSSGSMEPSASIECVGYGSLLGRYHYTDTASSSTQNITLNIQDILAADPNGITSSDYSNMSSNSTTATQYADGSETAVTIISEHVARGSTTRRWHFGIYEDRKPYFFAQPQTVEYYAEIASGSRINITGANGVPIPYWSLRPGKWLRILGYQGEALSGDADELAKDPQTVFVETVSYSTPWGLSVQGSKNGGLREVLTSSFGLGGV